MTGGNISSIRNSATRSGGHEIRAPSGQFAGGLCSPVVGGDLGVERLAVGRGEIDGSADVSGVQVELSCLAA